MSEFKLESAKLDELVLLLENSYFAFDRLHHIDSECLPSQNAIHSLTRNLFALAFPGFFGRQDLTRKNIETHLRAQLEHIGQELFGQITYCFNCRKKNPGNQVREKAHEVTTQFLASMPKIREMLASDILAAYRGDPAAADTDEVVFSYPATLAIGTYRMAHALLVLGVPLMPRIMTERAHSLTGIDIHPGTQIGKGFFIDHGTGVVIGETAIIGDNCKLYQGVTLGALSFPHDDEGQIIRGQKRHPTLEDDVVVYANATILGDVTIGKGATVGGNIFLTKSVPSGCTVTSKQAELKYRYRAVTTDRPLNKDFEI